ncbi:uncharacterized mitochondrial protein-like protein, partial [Tanacetum coccineum]
MENEHELSYETLTRVYLGSYEHYKSVGAEVESLEPGFELQGAKMVEMGRFGIIREQRIAAYNGYEIREWGMRMYEGLWVLFIGKGPLEAKVHKLLRRVKVLVMEVIAHGWSLKWVKMKENKPRIIFGSTKKSWCDEFEALMKSRFQMSSMGELTFFLGLQVKQKADGIFISQDKYVAEILKKFDFVNVKTASTLIETQKPLVKDEEASDVDVHLYRSMIDSLMYLTASRPDIMFAVCACSRFQVTPKTSHLSAVKRIF